MLHENTKYLVGFLASYVTACTSPIAQTTVVRCVLDLGEAQLKCIQSEQLK